MYLTVCLFKENSYIKHDLSDKIYENLQITYNARS